MTLHFTALRRAGRAAATAALLLACAAAGSQAREMRLSSFEPPQGFYSSRVLQVWIDEVNAKLSPENRFKLYPGSILGAPPAQAELVKKGVADAALVVPTYTPGVFPMSTVVEVPGIAPTSGQGTQILNTLAGEGLLGKEFDDYKVIALFTTPGYRLFLTKKDVTGPADLQGLKLRTPSPFGSTLLSMLGAAGVSIPAPQVYENLERGVVSGAVWVFDAYKTFRLSEVAPTVVAVRLTAQPMAILMNRATYEALPEADRAVIDAMSGPEMAKRISGIVDAYDADQEKAFRADGKVSFIDPADPAQWTAGLAGAPAAWVAAQPQGGDAAAVLARAQALATAK